MGKYFGTDGFRGEAGITLTADHAYKVGRFLGWYYNALRERNGDTNPARIVIGKDTRRSSYMFEYSLVAGLTASGADAYLLHVTTTPSVAYIARVDDFDCGIMISASHNPYYDNGIKLIDCYGEKMPEEILLLVEDYIDGKLHVFDKDWPELPFAHRESIGCTVDYVAGRNRYMGYLISLGIYSFKGVKVGLDCANGASWNIAKSVFDALGADTYVINNKPNGLNINNNAGSTHIEGLQKFVVEKGLDIGFAYDGDLGNVFIWSGFKYYLRQPTDSYIVYSPVKYWKAQHLIDRKFVKGFAYNRRHFHTNIDACIMCAYWQNIADSKKEIEIAAYDIDDNTGTLVSCGLLPVKQVFTTYSKIYYDKRPIPDEQRTGILAGLNGLEKVGGKQRNKPATAPDIMGYMVAHSSGFDNPDLDSSLLIAARYDGNGFFLRKDNYLEKLPMFCASRYITYNRAWTERARIMKSADGADRYNADVASGKLAQFLLKCLLFTCTEMQNHMRTFTGSDGRFYRDELCLDGTNGKTIALRDIKGLIPGDREKAILNQWETVLQWAKKAENYSPSLTYGVYQIYAELDTSHVDETTGNTIWDNVELHTALAGLKTLVKDYYNSEIVPVLFEYEFIK